MTSLEHPAGAADFNGAQQRLRKPERFARILELLSANGSVDVTHLATKFRVSEATVRRDLQALSEQRLLERAHGGALSPGTAFELPVRYRVALARPQKQAIARAAVERIHEGDVVALTGGTTTTELGRHLAQWSRLSVVTNAVNIAAALAIRSNLKLIVTGGVARTASYELVGPLAEATLSRINIDVAFIGVDGIHPEAGLTTQNETEAVTNRALIERSRRVIVLADATKLGRVVFASICPLGLVDELITDRAAEEREVETLRAAGVKVTVV